MGNRAEIISALDRTFNAFRQVDRYAVKYGYGNGKEYRMAGRPEKGWLNHLRTSLNLPVKLMSKKIGKKYPQSIIEFEKSEKDETISLKNLREVGRAMGMELVYGFVPTSVESMKDQIEGRVARKLKKEFSTMSHELIEPGHPKDFSNNSARSATKTKIYEDFPKSIWDSEWDEPPKLPTLPK